MPDASGDEQVTALVGEYDDGDANKFVKLLKAAFLSQHEYSQQELVDFIREHWGETPPGINTLRKMIDGQVGNAVFRE